MCSLVALLHLLRFLIKDADGWKLEKKTKTKKKEPPQQTQQTLRWLNGNGPNEQLSNNPLHVYTDTAMAEGAEPGNISGTNISKTFLSTGVKEAARLPASTSTDELAS